MKAKTILFFLILSALIPQAYAADFGEDQDYLGQVVDDYENDDNVAAAVDVIHNSTLECMELEYVISGIYENLTFYTEVDPNNKISIPSAYRVLMTDISRNEGAYLYYDFGVDYFGDFRINFTVFRDFSEIEHSSYGGAFAVSNDIDDGKNLDDGIRVLLGNDKTVPMHAYTYLWEVGQTEDSHIESWSDDIIRYYTVERVGTVSNCYIYSDENRTVLMDILNRNVASTKYRYLYVAYSFNTGTLLNYTGYNEYFFNVSKDWRYETSGYYTTVDMLGGDYGIALMYNATIPSTTAMTIEFYNGSAWVDHNNEVGSDSLINGYETIDTRDIYPTACPVRVNQTSNALETPRMYQLRWITVTTITTDGGLFPGLAIGISLLIIGAIYAIEKRR